MRLEGIHHVTAITGDAPGNVDFYAGLLGLRLVKKTVNQDDPTVYHLFYADEHGSARARTSRSSSTRARSAVGPARDGAPVVLRVASEEALDFWAARLGAEGVEGSATEGGLRFRRSGGARARARRRRDLGRAARRREPGDPAEFALQGFDGVRA